MTSAPTEHPDLVRPFRLDIPQSDLDDLHDRLDRTRWPDDLSATGWAYGVPAGYLRELAHHWRHSYDWRAAEARLNEWPQFTTVIDGTTVHFAHVRSPSRTPPCWSSRTAGRARSSNSWTWWAR